MHLLSFISIEWNRRFRWRGNVEEWKNGLEKFVELHLDHWGKLIIRREGVFSGIVICLRWRNTVQRLGSEFAFTNNKKNKIFKRVEQYR